MDKYTNVIPVNTYWYKTKNDLIVGTVENKYNDYCDVAIYGNDKRGIVYYNNQSLNADDINVGSSYLFRVVELSTPCLLDFCLTSDFSKPFNMATLEKHEESQNETSLTKPINNININNERDENGKSCNDSSSNSNLRRGDNLVFCKITGEQSYGIFAEVNIKSETFKGLLHRSKMMTPLLSKECINHFGFNWYECFPALNDSYFLAKIEGRRDLNKLSLTQRQIKLTETRKIFENISNNRIRMYVLGVTGCGKSSVINAILNKDIETKNIFSPVGYGSAPETQTFVSVKYKNLTIIDTPGLGDSPRKDSETIKEIEYRMSNDADTFDNRTIILIVYDASSRDYGATFNILDSVKKYSSKQIIHVLNKIDIFQRDNDVDSERFNLQLNAKLQSIKDRVECYDSSPVICPISAGSDELDFKVDEKNISELIEAIGVITDVS